MTSFDTFVGIDWSGAKGEFHKGIQVARIDINSKRPTWIMASHAKGWSRQAVVDYLQGLVAEGRTVLAGIDFAFAHPFYDRGSYYPECSDIPQISQGLWALIDHANKDQDYLYGGGIWGHAELRHYYNAPKNKDGRGGKGKYFQSRRRVTEMVAASMNMRSPSPTFNCVGPAGVGTGSLAGMRMLHQLQDQATIWPFTPPQHEKGPSLTLVEIYPALYFKMADVSDKFKKDEPLNSLNQGLKHFGSLPVDDIASGLPDSDDIDAMISAAALRDLHDPYEIFPIDEEHLSAAQREGWIFGAGRVKT